jgi:hypothetical protein
MLKTLLLLGKRNFPQFFSKKTYAPLFCYRNPSLSPISGTCSTFLLPKSSQSPNFGHMFHFLAIETPRIPRFRAHDPLSCYRNSSHPPISGTCSSSCDPTHCSITFSVMILTIESLPGTPGKLLPFLY